MATKRTKGVHYIANMRCIPHLERLGFYVIGTETRVRKCISCTKQLGKPCTCHPRTVYAVKRPKRYGSQVARKIITEMIVALKLLKHAKNHNKRVEITVVGAFVASVFNEKNTTTESILHMFMRCQENSA